MRTKSAGFIIFNNNNEILLGKTNWNPINSWTVFKGMVESGETLLQTAQRELKEETDVDLPQSSFSNEVFYEYKMKNKDVYLFLYEDLKEIIDIKKLKCNSFWTGEKNDIHPEILEYRWFSLQDAHKCVMHSQKGLIKFLASQRS